VDRGKDMTGMRTPGGTEVRIGLTEGLKGWTEVRVGLKEDSWVDRGKDRTDRRTPGWTEVNIGLTGELQSVQVGLKRGLNGKARTDKRTQGWNVGWTEVRIGLTRLQSVQSRTDTRFPGGTEERIGLPGGLQFGRR
jgi:hypothetical protein